MSATGFSAWPDRFHVNCAAPRQKTTEENICPPFGNEQLKVKVDTEGHHQNSRLGGEKGDQRYGEEVICRRVELGYDG